MMRLQFWLQLIPQYFGLYILYCIVGWVDIGTGTKVPLRFVTYLSKVTKITKKTHLPLHHWLKHFESCTILYRGPTNFFTIWTSWVSKDAEFYVYFKNINLSS
jgi:hypothetical protein